jgi:outer membrane protein assembly factor BamB
MTGVVVGCGLLLGATGVGAQDWPQWRGPNRDNKAESFAASPTWPKTLTQKWKKTVGGGDSSPVLVGDKVYVFSRQGGNEVITCLKASNGDIVWQDKYAAKPAEGNAGGIHAGPRATPAVAEGKVCTFGARGTLSCLDAEKGAVAWRKESKSWPQFFMACSPIIVDGKCIAYFGGGAKGEIVAYDLASGDEKWKWTGDGPSYGSPVLMTVEGTKQIVMPTLTAVVGIGAADGKLLWRFPFKAKYNSGTPVVAGQTVIYSGTPAGTVAFKVEKQGDKFETQPLWKKSQSFTRFNTPVLKDGLLYGLSDGKNFFCMDAKNGDVLWTDNTKHGECGEIISAGTVLLALTSDKKLIVFQPSDKGYMEIAQYTVADTATWAYPIVAGNRVFVKDQNTLTLFAIE